MPTIYEDLVAAGVPVRNYRSDLYVPVNEITKSLIKRMDDNRYDEHHRVTEFVTCLTGELMYGLSGAYYPYWEKLGFNTSTKKE
jgi:hypothetical protein